jgi:hypothetical protein
MGGQQLAGHPGAQLPFLGVGGIGTGLGQGLAVGTAVHVDVLHADQPGPTGLGGQHAGLQAGEQLDPLVIGRVESLVDDLGTLGGGRGKAWVAGVAAEDLDVVGNWGGAGAVDQPHPFTPAAQGFQVARPMAPVPKTTCRGVAAIRSQLQRSLGAGWWGR